MFAFCDIKYYKYIKLYIKLMKNNDALEICKYNSKHRFKEKRREYHYSVCPDNPENKKSIKVEEDLLKKEKDDIAEARKLYGYKPDNSIIGVKKKNKKNKKKNNDNFNLDNGANSFPKIIENDSFTESEHFMEDDSIDDTFYSNDGDFFNNMTANDINYIEDTEYDPNEQDKDIQKGSANVLNEHYYK